VVGHLPFGVRGLNLAVLWDHIRGSALRPIATMPEPVDERAHGGSADDKSGSSRSGHAAPSTGTNSSGPSFLTLLTSLETSTAINSSAGDGSIIP